MNTENYRKNVNVCKLTIEPILNLAKVATTKRLDPLAAPHPNILIFFKVGEALKKVQFDEIFVHF